MNKKLFSFWSIVLAISLLLGACTGGAANQTRPTQPAAPVTEAAPATEPPAATEEAQATESLAAETQAAAETAVVTPEADSPYRWWNNRVFYEIFVRSFYDSNGDGIGDFNGITAKLDYLNDGNPETTTDLGIGGLWLMPIFASPSYHGYDATDYLAVNPDYGTLDDFKRLLEEAHKRDIKVIIDLMLNHTSVEHPWFQGSLEPGAEYRDWYVWSDTDPGGMGPWNQDVWHEGPQGGFYYGVFWEGMPDLNYQNPEVTAQMKEVARFWIEDAGVDGFRLDGARYLVEEGANLADTKTNQAWFVDFNQYVKSLNPEALVLAEIWTSSFTVVGYLKSKAVDLAFDFDLASAFVKSATGQRASSAQSQLAIDTKAFPPGAFAPFLTNHDQDRVMNQVGRDLAKAKNAAALLLTAPGVPFIYYGEEIGMLGAKPDERIRTPMQWSAEEKAGFTTGSPWESLNGNFDEFNVAGQTDDPASLLSHYRTLIQLRNAHPALQVGETLKVVSDAPEVYAVLRTTAEETLLVIVNLSDEAVREYALTLDAGPLPTDVMVTPLLGQGDFAGLSATAEGGFADYTPLPELPGNSVFVLQLQ